MNDVLWLRCIIGPGQFSDECAISGDTFDGEGFSLFAPEEFTIAEGHVGAEETVKGWVQVEEIDREGELVLIKLPRQTLENGMTITVSASELEKNPSRQEA